MNPYGAKRRLKPLDVVILAVVAAIVGFFVYKVDAVLSYEWDWSVVPRYLLRRNEDTGALAPNLFVLGLLTTIRLAIWSLVLSAIIGGIMGVMRTSRRLFPRLLSRAYVELIRNTPPLVFIFVFYFFISGQIMPLLGIDALVSGASPLTASVIEWIASPPKLFSNFLAGVICLSMFSGAYVTEIVRAGIQSIPRSQIEAGASIGLSRFKVMRLVVLPQALQRVIPPLAGQFIILIKDSSLVSLISIQELTFYALEIAVSTTQVFEVWIFVGFLYFVICYTCALAFDWMERRSKAAYR
ncbi:MAG: amino acid ABC transporter permease [Immundisolibacterales bacterium]|nr:amino acid ABC transporter permease [Immundisolibacterales bacterium]